MNRILGKKNKKLNGNILSFDIVVSIGNGEDKKTSTIHIDKEVTLDPVLPPEEEPEEDPEEEPGEEEPKVDPPKEENPVPENPKTGDNILMYISVLGISSIGIAISVNKIKKAKEFD